MEEFTYRFSKFKKFLEWIKKKNQIGIARIISKMK